MKTAILIIMDTEDPEEAAEVIRALSNTTKLMTDSGTEIEIATKVRPCPGYGCANGIEIMT